MRDGNERCDLQGCLVESDLYCDHNDSHSVHDRRRETSNMVHVDLTYYLNNYTLYF
jgi:hypothetical protein